MIRPSSRRVYGHCRILRPTPRDAIRLAFKKRSWQCRRTMAGVHLTLLGGFSGRIGPDNPLILPTRKSQALLAFLAIRPGTAHPRDKLAALLWAEMSRRDARARLRQAV